MLPLGAVDRALDTDFSSESTGGGAAAVIVAGRLAQPMTIITARANGMISPRMRTQCSVIVL
jgi:hypothetical protein